MYEFWLAPYIIDNCNLDSHILVIIRKLKLISISLFNLKT